MISSLKSFESMILFFNGMYKLSIASYPSFAEQAASTPNIHPHNAIADRLRNFKNIILEEIEEVDDIIANLGAPGVDELDVLVDMADWLGDIQVYCASEMVRFGIPVDDTLRIIMDSNFSKLGENGEPLYDTRGKVQKGPGYWKPEPKIKEMLEARIAEHNTLAGTSPGLGG